MSEVTRILSQIEAGDPAAAEQLLPLVYHELRKLAAAKIAQEQPGHTLQATALVHEAYLRLVGPGQPETWQGRSHFLAAAAESMRRILIERARRKSALKRGGGRRRVSLEDIDPALDQPADQVLALDEALTALAEMAPQKAELVKLRFYAGLTIPEAAAALGISHATAERYWTYARTWLFCRLKEAPSSEEIDPNLSAE
jgi:RNA polymerase sigma factor (TIGR02999 family)